MPRFAHTVDVAGGQPLTIYAETANINYFLNEDLEPDILDGPTNDQSAVPGHSRRQYPGDGSQISVSGSSREFLSDPSRVIGTSLPGRSFVLLERGGNEEKRQFTYRGRLMDLHAFITGNANKDVYLYGNTGARYTIDAVAAP